MKHLLVTNDFPPKTGGIQQYLWELWRRLPPGDVTVLTTPHHGSHRFDSEQPFRVVRAKQWWLLPTRKLIRQINALADEVDAEMIVLDPAFPLGLCGPKLNRPYVLIGHGAEYAIPARLPLAKQLIANTTRKARGLIASGEYVATSMRSVASNVATAIIPPGVDIERFAPIADDEKLRVREKWSVAPDALFVFCVSRLVPRKGFDRVIKAAASVDGVEVVIAGKGRDAKRLQRLIDSTRAPARLIGRVDDADLPELYAAADVFAMPCHDRWFGLEKEGYGIVFVEAAAAGVPSIAGMSGGSAEAVIDGETGLIVHANASADDVARALRTLGDRTLRERLGANGRARAERELSYERLAKQLNDWLSAR